MTDPPVDPPSQRYADHRDSQWVISAISAAPVVAFFSIFMPFIGAPAALVAVVLAAVAIRQRLTHHRGLLTIALVISAGALLWSATALLFFVSARDTVTLDAPTPAYTSVAPLTASP